MRTEKNDLNICTIKYKSPVRVIFVREEIQLFGYSKKKF